NDFAFPQPAPRSSDSFTWVQPMINNRKRKTQYQIEVPGLDAGVDILGITPPPKKAKITSHLVSDSKVQKFLEIAKPKGGKSEKEVSISNLETPRILFGESTPEGE
ncbi:hypothetical protein KI387_015144, partial [Taxus chinensis]